MPNGIEMPRGPLGRIVVYAAVAAVSVFLLFVTEGIVKGNNGWATTSQLAINVVLVLVTANYVRLTRQMVEHQGSQARAAIWEAGLVKIGPMVDELAFKINNLQRFYPLEESQFDRAAQFAREGTKLRLVPSKKDIDEIARHMFAISEPMWSAPPEVHRWWIAIQVRVQEAVMGMYFVHQWHEDAEADALANRRSLTLDSMKSAWRRSGIWSNDAGWDLASSGDLTAEAFSATSSLAEALLAYRLGDVSRLELSERAAALACEAARSA